MSRFKKDIPDRWLDYKGIGDKIAGTPFVAFKVPLHRTICENLPEYERHTTREVIEALPELGLVIDLTNTPNRTRYYQPYDWRVNGIDYKWIKCEGHVTPPQETLIHFCRTVKKFMNKNPTKLISVHCTHGLNRTGYFICSFMVLVLRIPPHEALRSFADARGHHIERENYINSIISHHENSDLQRKILDESSKVSMPFPIRENLSSYHHRRSRTEYHYEGRHRYENQLEARTYREHRQQLHNRSQHRFHPFLPPTSHRSGARQNNFSHYQRDKSFHSSSRRRRDDNQNYNN